MRKHILFFENNILMKSPGKALCGRCWHEKHVGSFLSHRFLDFPWPFSKCSCGLEALIR